MGEQLFAPSYPVVVQRADVGVNAGGRESDAETRRAQRCLRQSDSLLWRGDDEPRVYSIGR